MKVSIIAATAGATVVMGHGFITDINAGGKTYIGFNPFNGANTQSITQSWDISNSKKDGPMLVRDGDGMVCQNGAKPAQQSAEVAAGSKITFRWNQWPPDHKGPIITYLADCGGDCSSADGSKLSWFKTDETGLVGKDWATDILIKQGNTWNIQLPKNIKDGNYLMRHEIISLHDASSSNGAQIYPTCINLKITGGGGQANPQGVKIQEIYTANEPSLKVSTKNNDVTTYKIPGPPVDPQIGGAPSAQLNTRTNPFGGQLVSYTPNLGPDGKNPGDERQPLPQNTSQESPKNGTPSKPVDGTHYPDNGSPSSPTSDIPTASSVPSNPSTGPSYPDNTPSYPDNGPGNQTNGTEPNLGGPKPQDRKVCDDSYVQCASKNKSQKRFRFRRGVQARQNSDYRSEPCYQTWEQCMNNLGGARA
ncbi:hypothetical protein H072_7397 [Dactylellina haptotyla CBS 200.50]|uniref:lytic cellulose monooxygenase (C4-dehydrogenating) n=1 Tax=Dactylellina haptotyla (strain CBS 200.50) TaxID=1284197 RepID=S8A794_DACHA|nr:hypothetical protein H072_7397 [Dactylellina haptotyla CBS 200.50]